MDRADFLALRFLSSYVTLCFREIRLSAKVRVSLWNFVSKSGVREFRHGTPTVDECDINSDSWRSAVDSTWG